MLSGRPSTSCVRNAVLVPVAAEPATGRTWGRFGVEKERVSCFGGIIDDNRPLVKYYFLSLNFASSSSPLTYRQKWYKRVFHEQSSIGLAKIKRCSQQGAGRDGRRPCVIDHAHQQGPQETFRAPGPEDRRSDQRRGAVSVLVRGKHKRGPVRAVARTPPRPP